jgi:hypothetical protein
MKTIGIFLIFTGFIFLNSCNKEEARIEPQADLSDQIGYWHNVAVEAVLDNPDFNMAMETGSLTGPSIRDLIMKELSKRDPGQFDFETMRMDLSWSDQILAEKGILNETSFTNLRKSEGPSVKPDAVFKYLHQKKEIGPELFNKFTELNKKVMSNNISREEIIKLSLQFKNLPLSEKEESYVEVFNQVLSASNACWTKNHARIQGDRTVGIIWADAAGGLYGMLCGPVCSIIEAAMFSTIVAIQ